MDINQFMVIFAYNLALNDATMQRAYTGSKSNLNWTIEAEEHIKEYIKAVFNGKLPDFYELANKLREDYKDFPDFTFGNIQKLINMTAKYMCIGTYDDAEKRQLFKCCHCPMDKIMIQRVVQKYKELMDDSPDTIDRDNYYFIVDGKKSHAWSSVSWSNIDFDGEGINSIEVYKKYQEMVKVICAEMSKESEEEVLPIELDFIEWGNDWIEFGTKNVVYVSGRVFKNTPNGQKTIIPNQAEGIAAAKAKGVKFGRPKIDLPKNFDEVYQQFKDGKITGQEAAKRLKMSPSTFWYKIKNYEQDGKTNK